MLLFISKKGIKAGLAINPDTTVEDIKDIMGKKRHRDFPVLDKEDNYVGMISRRNLLNVSKKKVILVDHNEESQAVNGIEFADIQEIIDHHRIGSWDVQQRFFIAYIKKKMWRSRNRLLVYYVQQLFLTH